MDPKVLRRARKTLRAIKRNPKLGETGGKMFSKLQELSKQLTPEYKQKYSTKYSVKL